jgi:hypothetical protein
LLQNIFFSGASGSTPIFRCFAAVNDIYFAGTDNGLYVISKKDHTVKVMATPFRQA